MTTGTIIMNVALMVGLTIVLAVTMFTVPNIDRIGAWRRQRLVRQARARRVEQRARAPYSSASA